MSHPAQTSLLRLRPSATFTNAPYSVAVFAADSATEINLFASPGTTYTLGLQRSGSGSTGSIPGSAKWFNCSAMH